MPSSALSSLLGSYAYTLSLTHSLLNGIRHKADHKRTITTTTTAARHLDFEHATCRRRRRQRRLLRG